MIDFCGLRLAHPIINGSGTFDAIAARRAFGDALLDAFPFSAFVSKTITLAPRAGNPPPRLWEAQAGMINSIGLPNRGLAGYLEHDLPQLAQLPVPLITNVMGSTAAEVAQLVEALDARPEVAAIELNVSCPNVATGLDIGADPASLGALVRAVRPLTAQAADRQAHAEHGGRRCRRAGRRGGRRRRRVADQHAARDGPGPAWRNAVAGRSHRRDVGAGHPQRGARAGFSGGVAGIDPGRRDGRRRARNTRK